jgi:hypothetical protein
MDFTLNANANTNGTSKRGEIPDITTSMMEQAFGKSYSSADSDPEYGYSGQKWTFVSSDGQVVTVYERFHKLRVGAHSDSIFEPFVVWLRDMITKSKQHDKLQKIFLDNFSNNANGWLVKEETEIFLQVENGGYVIEHRQDSGWWATWRSFPHHTQAALGIQIKIQRILGSSDSYYGIVWGLVDVNNFCYMLVNPKKQFTLGRFIDNKWQPLTSWTIAPLRHEVGSINEIAVFIQRGFLELQINGFQVFKNEWKNSISGNNIGFLVGPVMKVKVLALTVSEDNSVQIPRAKKFTPATIQRTHVASSNLRSVGYDNSSRILEIEFTNGAVYRYYGVPQRIYVELMQTHSHGEYFSAIIRDKFQYQQVQNKSMQQTDHLDDYDDYDDYGDEGYDLSDLRSDLGMDFMSDGEFDDWLDDQTGGRD